MPLVRVEVRNEYGLGMPELYSETNREDPKAVLDGVAVAGLVGILRQLGDLAEFAAEVFHGLQEEVLMTSSRSHKLVERVHNIEAALPPLEKAILAQRSHLHFAYTAGSHWHTRLRTEQNHFIYSDLPRCIMDSYEECRDPPRLHKLDKFDIGGPGACFKRYSDPTYFKRASASSYEAHLRSAPREKKARRNKKKRSSRFRDGSHSAPVTTTHGGILKGKTSPNQDVSTIHVAPKSGTQAETEDRLTSFDSRTGSGYIECIFRPSCSTQSEENEAKDLSSDSKVQHNSYLDSPSIDENSGDPDENIHNSYLEEQIGPKSSYSGDPDENIRNSYLEEQSGPMSTYVTWDEKLEIMDSAGNPQPNDTREISCSIETLCIEENQELMPESVTHVDFDFRDEPVSIRGQPDEIESETDYYMDALNTIESESETDVDCQTKRELKQYPCVNKEDEEGIPKASQEDNSLVNFEFHVPEEHTSSISPETHMETYSSSNNETSEGTAKSGGFENSDHVASPHMADTSLVSLTSPDDFESEKVEKFGTNSEIVTSNGLSNFTEPNSDPLLSTNEPPKPSLSTSESHTTVNHPVMFWTNGGLLGLEPSKPSDFGSPLTAVAPVSAAKIMTQNSNQKNTIEDNGHVRADMAPNTSKSEIDGPSPKADATTDNKENISSSRILEFSNRLLVNGFRRQISLVGDERLASSVRSDVPEKSRMHQNATGKPFRDQFGSGSPSSSPPLEHMKISFQPIDGFETSKLKLKFPDGDTFPSFQLVPEPSLSLHESGSESDDDTFCRSSPYASDDFRSHHSDSNSEQWDSGDSPRSKDHELDNTFGRISPAESVSSSLVNGITSKLDIPNFDSLNDSIEKVMSESDGKCVVGSCTPPPPPLPPLEWRGIKPHPDVTMEKEGSPTEAFTHLTPPEPAVPQQPKPPPLQQDHFVDNTPKGKQPDWPNHTLQNERNGTINANEKGDFLQQIRMRQSELQNSNVQNESTNAKVINEKDDFLQQIRTKSMNLRRTATARPTITPAAPNNVKVTAILEKANAIRQAVGSDDDTWSDT